ncbi:MAG: HupE/UreJ family protein [Bauldia sp.]
MRTRRPRRGGRLTTAALLLPLLAMPAALAHGIGGKDAAFVAAANGPELFAFAYLGAKHMVTGVDHLLFLAGIIFFLYRLKHVALYVTLFSLGHSATLLAGVLLNLSVNAYFVDALIGLSIVYKAFDNLDGFHTLFGLRPDPRIAIPLFGLAHGFGLATKLLALAPPPEALAVNLVAFNVGVEIGQLLALSLLFALIAAWRRTTSFARLAIPINAALLAAGILITELQVHGMIANGG